MAVVRTDPHSKQLTVAVDTDTLDALEKEGRTLAKYRPRLAKFAEMLAHPEFAEFFDQNFQTWDDCETSIMLLKTGASLRSLMSQSSGEEISGHQLTAALAQAMNHSETRQYMVARLRAFVQARPSAAHSVSGEMVRQ